CRIYASSPILFSIDRPILQKTSCNMSGSIYKIRLKAKAKPMAKAMQRTSTTLLRIFDVGVAKRQQALMLVI
ncbi:MAG: hypothetical protein NTX25_09045, partial [Proteobacteria bacterium]|nr:hypothetical protein [Pseudomonadota bacterium]